MRETLALAEDLIGELVNMRASCFVAGVCVEAEVEWRGVVVKKVSAVWTPISSVP